MKQWLVRRGLLATLPLVALVAFGLDACSSEPGSRPTATDTAKPTAAESGQTSAERELAPSQIARDRLARVSQFMRIIKVAKPDAATTSSARRKFQLPDLTPEARPVVALGEAERFVQQGERIRAHVDPKLKAATIHGATVDLPPKADGFVRVQADGTHAGIEFAAKGAKSNVALESADGLATYPGAAPGGGDMVLRVSRDTVEDFVVLEQKPEQTFVDYRVNVSEIEGLRLYDNTLEFLAKDGDPQLRVNPPELIDADGKAHRAEIQLPDCAADHSAAVPWDRPVTAPGAAECTLRISWDDANVVYPAIVDPAWAATGSLATARFRNAGVKQPSNGFVITCGGIDNNGDALKSCEVFNPGANNGVGAWSPGPTMKLARSYFTMIAVSANEIVALGDNSSMTSEWLNVPGAAWTANLTDFSTGAFYMTQFTPVLTSDGTYIIAIDQNGKAYKYTVATRVWTAGASNGVYRSGYETLAVPGLGTVMRCGGGNNLKTCEKYTPATDLWAAAGTIADMNAARSYAGWATIDGTHVMLYGGYNTQAGTYINSAEIYNSSNNTWTSNTPSIPNNVYESELHSTWAVHGGSGKIMTISSYYPTLYDPTTAVWTQAGQSDGVNYFYSMGSQGGIASVGNKVLLFPVSPNGSYSPSAICKLFDYVQQGGICSADTDCKTGLKCVYDNQAYVDGQSVCCDATCTDECSSCRAANKESKTGEGACGPRDHTQSVAYNKCPYESPSTCGNVGYKCDGKGACAKWDSSTTCLSQGCADTSTQNNDAKCDGKGTCGTQTTTACTTGYNCVYSQCYTQCGDDYFCANNYYCQYWASPAATVNQCLQRKANGKACTNNSTTECASGNCVDGFCCDTACNGGCEACSNALTGKTNGVCSAIPAGQASNKDCNDQFPASCGQTGFCNGARACQKYASGTPCADLAACAGEGTRYVPDQCDGSGTCTDKGTQPCNTGYSCQGGVCNTSCTSDANCISAYFCDTVTSTCVADHKQGQTCKSAQGCEGNANCVDGVCCDSACTGTCRSCVKNRTGLAADGVCGNTLDDTDPEAECPIDVGYPASCKAPGTCADNGTCRVYAKPGVQAKADACSSGTLTVTTCDGAGNPTHVDTACYPYKCNAANTACRVACTKATEDTDCDDSSFCQDGKCIGVLPQGTACTEGTQCKSGFCADQHLGALEGDPAPDPGAGGDSSVDPVDHPGVCCDSACGNGCEACKKSLKAQGADGTCGKVADHTDAKGDCKSAADKPCGHNNECDGSGNCRNVPSGASCGSSSCVGNSARGQICDGNGGCVNDSAILCTPYVCRDVNGAQQCTNPCAEDNDCDDGYYCVETACKKKLAPGKTCDSSGICASGFCVDGVCCDVSCKGQCEACDVPGSEGVCSPVQGDPHGDRPVCDHSGEECGGACDGVNSAACKYAAVGTSCGTTTCDNDLASSSECNGQGECKANKNTECSPYTCGTDDTCLSRCEQDADCSQGYGCDETTQRCLPAAVSTTCSEDRLTSVGQNGQSTPCKPFLCVPASGSCAVSCAFTTDCAPDFVCEPSTKTCLPAPAGTGDDTSGSCACRAAGATQSRSGYWALAAFGVALSSLRRRRRSKRPALNLAKSPLAQDSHPFE